MAPQRMAIDPIFDKKQGAFAAFEPIIKALATLFFTVIGLVIGCTVGALAYPVPPGVGAITGSLVGGVLSGIIGCFATGFIWDFVPEEEDLLAMVPDAVAEGMMGGYRSFSSIVTIHEVKDVNVSGRLLWSSPELFVMVDCPDNPLKQTCVKKTGDFNEQFKIDIKKGTKHIVFLIKDRRLFGCANVGYVSVDVETDIIFANFPSRKEFVVEAGEDFVLAPDPRATPLLVMSFEPADGKKWPYTAATGGRPLVKESDTNYSAPRYGSVKFLNHLAFNQGAKLNYPNYADAPVTGFMKWSDPISYDPEAGKDSKAEAVASRMRYT